MSIWALHYDTPRPDADSGWDTADVCNYLLNVIQLSDIARDWDEALTGASPSCQPADPENTGNRVPPWPPHNTPRSPKPSPENLITYRCCLLSKLIHFKMGLISPSPKMFDLKGGNIFPQTCFSVTEIFLRAAFPFPVGGSWPPARGALFCLEDAVHEALPAGTCSPTHHPSPLCDS